MYKFMKHKIVSTLEIRASGLAEVHQWNKVDFPFVCLLLDLLSFLINCCFLHPESLLLRVRDLFARAHVSRV